MICGGWAQTHYQAVGMGALAGISSQGLLVSLRRSSAKGYSAGENLNVTRDHLSAALRN